MTQIIVGRADEFPAGLQARLASFRYQVFIERLAWNVPLRTTECGHELDQFDRVDTVYVVGSHSGGQVYGCARLLPTTSPYLLGEVFPEMVLRRPGFCGPEIWEMSRFAAVPPGRVGDPSNNNARRILAGVVEYAVRHGIGRLIGVTFLGMERLLRSMGVHVHRVGPPEIIDHQPVTVCCLEIDHQTMDALGIDFPLPAAVNGQAGGRRQ